MLHRQAGGCRRAHRAFIASLLGAQCSAIQLDHEPRDETGRAPLAVPERDVELTALRQRLIGPGGQELVPSIRTTTSPEGCTWATVVGLHTMMSCL
jgi:hypothetical protein